MKPKTKYILFLLFIFSVLTAVEYYQPEPINWRPSYSKYHKIPFGNYVVYDLLPEIFPGKKLEVTDLPIYNTLNKLDNYSDVLSNYIIITDEFDAGEQDIDMLMDYVYEGNFVFIAANTYRGLLADTFKIKTTSLFPLLNAKDSIGINFSASMKTGENYNYKKESAEQYFSKYDTTPTTVLGYNSRWEVNFIFAGHGKGGFYLSTVPLVFTNYNILPANHAEYVSKALSLLPIRNTYWDEYYKPMRVDIGSPIGYIMETESLRWAYWIVITGILLYMIFEGKRKQRIIPVMEPPRNTSLAFVESVGRLYFAKRSDVMMGLKMIRVLRYRIRTEFNIDLKEYNNKLYEELSYRSNMEVQELQKLFAMVSFVELSHSIEEADLMELNKYINSFYNHIKK